MSILRDGKTPVLLPSRILFDLDPIEKTWEITSDAIAAWFVWLLGAKKFAILTDVDGIYAAGKQGSPEHLMSEISSAKLQEMGHTSVDACAAAFLSAKGLECMVINGFYPERLANWLAGERTVGTLIPAAR